MASRRKARRKIDPDETSGNELLEACRDSIWHFHQELKRYRKKPSQTFANQLTYQFEELFTQTTQWAALNDALSTIHSKKDELLLVLYYPQLPLHNNLSENDIRQFAKLRKISASSRSESGRRCRDTFLSLKTTCRKLGISFWNYLQDRITGTHKILPLGDLIRLAAK